MSHDAPYDVIVVGAGIMGSASAFYASQSARTLLLEQFSFLHRKGSSHGASRIFRLAYPDEQHTRLCLRAQKLWAEAEEKAGVTVLTYTGELDFGAKTSPVKDVLATLQKMNIPHEQLSAKDVEDRFPGIELDPAMLAVHSPDAGMVDATGACKMFQGLAKKGGADMRDCIRIVSLREVRGKKGEELVRVESDRGEAFFGRKIIVTAGAWASRLLQPHVRLETTCLKTAVAYWKCERPEEFHHSRCPVFINYDKPHVYGLPIREFPGLVKVCFHDGPECDPDSRGAQPDPEGIERVKHFINRYLRRVDASAPVRTETCQYTTTPDGLFVVDKLPGERIVVGAGFNGHGFKMAPAVGQALTELALRGNTDVEIGPFSLDRQSLQARSSEPVFSSGAGHVTPPATGHVPQRSRL